MAVQDLYTAFLDLSRRARHAVDAVELGFIAVNDTHLLTPYRQAALWFDLEGVRVLSGVIQPEANAPYVHWLKRVCRYLADTQPQATALTASELNPEEQAEWSEWLPAHALWIPLPGKPAENGVEAFERGGLLFARDDPWDADEVAMVAEWIDVWLHAWQAKFRPSPWAWYRWRSILWSFIKPKRVAFALGILAVLLSPVRLTVLAPGELVPSDPAIIRAPLDGVVGSFSVRPNEMVKAGQLLFDFDQAPLLARNDVARQALLTAEAEYRQAAQMALSDAKSKAQMAVLQGKIEERKAEAEFLQGQLARSHVVAPYDGIALFDDPSEWIGKPVVTGERIMRVAAPDDIEVEVWLPVGDAIPLAADAPVSLFLNASPLNSVSATVRYAAHDAVQRPDGSFAYRVRAKLGDKTNHRVGLKGTAKLSGEWVTIGYWISRRPIAAIRQALGW